MEVVSNDNAGRIPPVIDGLNQDNNDDLYGLDKQLSVQASETVDRVNKKKAFFIELQRQLGIMQNFLQYRSNIIDQGLLSTAFSGLLFCPEMDDKIKIKLTNDEEKAKIVALIEEANKSILDKKTENGNKKQTKEQLIDYKITKQNELKINVHDIYRLCNFALSNQKVQEGFALLVKANEEIKKHDEKEQTKEKIMNWVTFGVSIASTVATVLVEALVSFGVISLPMLTLPFSLPIIGPAIPILVVVTLIVSTLPFFIKTIAKVINQANRQEHGKDAKMDCLLNNKIIANTKGIVENIEQEISKEAKKGLFSELKQQQEQKNLTNNLVMNDNNIDINNNNKNNINNIGDNNIIDNINNNPNQNNYPPLTQNHNNINNIQENNDFHQPLVQNNHNNINNNNPNQNNFQSFTQNHNNINNIQENNDFPPLVQNNIFSNHNFNYDYNNIPLNNNQPLYNQNQNLLQQQNDNNLMQNGFA